MKNKQEEKQQCKVLSTWLRLKNIKHTHIANERKVPIYVGAEFKFLGVSKGFTDYFVYISKEQSIENRPLALWIEMKRMRKILKNGCESTENLLSDEQEEWLDILGTLQDTEAACSYGS